MAKDRALSDNYNKFSQNTGCFTFIRKVMGRKSLSNGSEHSLVRGQHTVEMPKYHSNRQTFKLWAIEFA